MNKKLVIGLSMVGIVTLTFYFGVVFYHRGYSEENLYSIRYEEASIIQAVNLSGVNSSRWDEFIPYLSPENGLDEADKIDQLPGQPKVSFRQYSGYVTVDGQTKRQLFYYFAESPNMPTERPLVLWLAGGPSCSSLRDVMMGLGPYRVLSDGATLGLNPYAWNNVANILFLETPNGVGFSYSDTISDYDLAGDKMTAQDSYTFLINWLERFPVYKNRTFYIAGDTYAGHYVPQLARIILRMNKKENRTTVINLQGILVENAVLDETCQSMGFYGFLSKHKLINKGLETTLALCDYHGRRRNFGTADNVRCRAATNELQPVLNSPFLAALADPICNLSSTKPQPVTNWTFDLMKFDPCTEEYTTTYLNMDQVRETLHAKKMEWFSCSNSIHEWRDNEISVLLVVKELMASGIRVWLYGGEKNAEQPPLAVEYGMRALDVQVKNDSYTWYNAPNEVGGNATEYRNLTFVTVQGVGGSIGSYAPAKALTIFSSFLKGEPLRGAW